MTPRTFRWWIQGLFVGLCALLLWPSQSEAVSTVDSVIVVPNPYNVSGRVYGLSSDVAKYERIDFVHVPTPCTIRIYTSNGNLVRTIEHNRPLSTASWDGRNTDNQYVASDVYIYVLEATINGQLQRKLGKLVIMR